MEVLATVETDMFEHREVKPHFINACCFGEDFAAWLRAKVMESLGPDFVLSEPIQEDYGWGLWVTRSKVRYWIAVSYVGDGPQDGPVQWVISVNREAGLNPINRVFRRPVAEDIDQVRASVRSAITSEPALKIVPNPNYGMT